jgi:hypothetical protein
LDWAKTLRKEGSRSAILRSDEFARRYGIAEAVVGNALRRQERRGLVEHVSRRLYVNKLAHDFSARELVSILRPNSYISLESALAELLPSGLFIDTSPRNCIGVLKLSARGMVLIELRNRKRRFSTGSICSGRTDCPQRLMN